MILQILHCPHCHGTDIVRHGQTRQGKQRYRCREQRCAGRTFLLDYSYRGQSPAVKEQIIDMAMNASGIRDTARVLHVSTNTVMTELKKSELVSVCGGPSDAIGLPPVRVLVIHHDRCLSLAARGPLCTRTAGVGRGPRWPQRGRTTSKVRRVWFVNGTTCARWSL
jgi:transposase-like protein